MNIALFDAAPYWSGGAERVYLCARGFQKAGQKVIVICLPTSRLNQLLSGKVRLYHLHPLLDISPLALIRILFILHKEKIDILDVHSPKFYWLALLAAKILGKKIVITRNVPYRKRGLKRWINSFLYQSCDGIVAVSRMVKKNLEDDFKLSGKKITVIYDGLELDLLSSEEHTRQRELIRRHYRISPEEILLVNINRIDRNKSQHLLIESVKLLHSRGYPVRAIIAGKVEDRRYFRELQKSIRGWEEKIFFTGFQENFIPYLMAADLFVSTSRQESLGRGIVASLLYGTPVVSTTVAGLEELFPPELVRFVEKCDSQLIAAAVAEAIDNLPEYRRKLEKIDRSIFSVDLMIAEYQQFYQSL